MTLTVRTRSAGSPLTMSHHARAMPHSCSTPAASRAGTSCSTERMRAATGSSSLRSPTTHSTATSSQSGGMRRGRAVGRREQAQDDAARGRVEGVEPAAEGGHGDGGVGDAGVLEPARPGARGPGGGRRGGVRGAARAAAARRGPARRARRRAAGRVARRARRGRRGTAGRRRGRRSRRRGPAPAGRTDRAMRRRARSHPPRTLTATAAKRTRAGSHGEHPTLSPTPLP